MEHSEMFKHPAARVDVLLTSCPQGSADQRSDTHDKVQWCWADKAYQMEEEV